MERAVGKYARAVFAKKERNRAVCPEHQVVRKTFIVREQQQRKEKETNIPLQKDSES